MHMHMNMCIQIGKDGGLDAEQRLARVEKLYEVPRPIYNSCASLLIDVYIFFCFFRWQYSSQFFPAHELEQQEGPGVGTLSAAALEH